jgi:hypothetical protein
MPILVFIVRSPWLTKRERIGQVWFGEFQTFRVGGFVLSVFPSVSARFVLDSDGGQKQKLRPATLDSASESSGRAGRVTPEGPGRKDASSALYTSSLATCGHQGFDLRLLATKNVPPVTYESFSPVATTSADQRFAGDRFVNRKKYHLFPAADDLREAIDPKDENAERSTRTCYIG